MSETLFSRRRTQVQGVLHSDDAYLIFPSSATDGATISAAGVLNFSASYNQPINRYFDLQEPKGGVTPAYLIVGRGTGSASVSHLVGPTVDVVTWYRKFGNACNACANEIGVAMVNSNCCANNASQIKLGYQLFDVVMNAMNIGQGSENTAIMHSLTLMFLSIQYNDGT